MNVMKNTLHKTTVTVGGKCVHLNGANILHAICAIFTCKYAYNAYIHIYILRCKAHHLSPLFSKTRYALLASMLTFFCMSASAQQFAAKTNLLYWAGTTPNIGAEIGLAKQWTLEMSAGLNPWTFNKEENTKMKHWMVKPEVRYWLCERFNGHFFGFHTGYAFYNISGIDLLFTNKNTKDYRYQGWATGVGLSYGHSWILSPRWNLEATLGLGYIFTKFDRYDCATCGKFRGTRDKHYFGPTKAGISLIYHLK